MLNGCLFVWLKECNFFVFVFAGNISNHVWQVGGDVLVAKNDSFTSLMSYNG